MRFKRFIVGIALFMIFLIISMPFCFAQEMILSYDANGNLVTGDGKYRVYNSLNQLYRVYNGSGTNGTLLYEFKYHPLEERVLVKKTYNTSGSLVETVYYWSQNFITVVNASGSYNFTYVYHNGDLVAQQNPDGSKLFVLGDNKGSTSVITNSSGSVLERTTYSPFGEVLSGGRLNRYGYEAKEQEMGFGKIPTDGLVSYYALEGGAFDDGKGNQGSVVNATLTTGKVRDGYSFDGAGDYIAINDSSNLDITGNLTLSAWVKPVENQAGYVVAKYGAYMIHLTGSPFVAQGGIWVGGGWNAMVSYNISLNQWTHVVFTYDRTQAKLYMNGVFVANYTKVDAIDTNNQILCIGAKNTTTRDRDVNASIDEVGVWNRALSSDEVTQLYNYGASFDSGYRSTDFEFRRYNSNTGLFEQPDTIIPNIFNPQALNRYMFELGNPLKHRDETGHYTSPIPFSIGESIYNLWKGTVLSGEYIGLSAKALVYGKFSSALSNIDKAAEVMLETIVSTQSIFQSSAKMTYVPISEMTISDVVGVPNQEGIDIIDRIFKAKYDELKIAENNLNLQIQNVPISNQNGNGPLFQLNWIVTHQNGGTWASNGGGSGEYVPPGGGNPYPTSDPTWEPGKPAKTCTSSGNAQCH